MSLPVMSALLADAINQSHSLCPHTDEMLIAREVPTAADLHLVTFVAAQQLCCVLSSTR